MQGFAGREREIAEQIFRLLVKDTALAVREALAARIKNNPEIPRDIVLHMAADVEQVAVPVLEASAVFSDADLVRALMGSLSAVTWIVFGVWMAVGLVFYFVYGYRRSRLATGEDLAVTAEK